MPVNRRTRIGLRTVALGYLALLLAFPVAFVFYRTFENGLGAIWDALTTPNAIHALELTLLMVAVAVPLNTAFGVLAALVIVRGRMPGRGFINAIIDLPFAISPVIVGLALFLLYGRQGWFGSWFLDQGIQIIFSTPGMILATVFVSLPFVVREVIPVLRETDTLPLYVEQRFQAFDLAGAYAASAVLAAIALATLLLMTKLKPREAET